MKKRLGLTFLIISSLALTSCGGFLNDGNWGSEYYSIAKEKVAAAGLDGKVIAGKMTSGNDFVSIEFNDITGDELIKASEVLATMNIPEATDRSIKWESKDKKIPSHLMFNTSKPNQDQIHKYAKIWDASKENVVYAAYNLNQGNANSRSIQPLMSFTLEPGTNTEQLKAMVNESKAIIGEPSINISRVNPAVDNPPILFSFSNGELGITAVTSGDKTDEALDLADEMRAEAAKKVSSYPGVKNYSVGIGYHMKAIGSDTRDFNISFRAAAKDSTDEMARSANDFQAEISKTFYDKESAIIYK